MSTKELYNKFKIKASNKNKYDAGLRDLFGCVEKNIKEHGHEPMANRNIIPNKGHVVSQDPENYPATDHLFELKAHYKIEDFKRNFVLIIEDMEVGYEDYVRHCIPNVKKLITQFRESKLPIVWTNWSRRHYDGHYNAVDRYYGPQAVTEGTNPCYIAGEDGIDTVAELAPQTQDEYSCSIDSLHLSKFADLDDDGREILFPMLEAWGVNTIVLCGAWTDDCLLTTIFDAVDKYGYDLILVRDGVATATVWGDPILEALMASTCCDMTCEGIVKHLKEHPDLVEAPKAPLNGNVYKTKTNYREDRMQKEIDALKERIKELEAK